MIDRGVVRLDDDYQALVDQNCCALRIVLYSIKWSDQRRQSTPCRRLGWTILSLRRHMATLDNPEGFRTLVAKSW